MLVAYPWMLDLAAGYGLPECFTHRRDWRFNVGSSQRFCRDQTDPRPEATLPWNSKMWRLMPDTGLS